MLDEVSQPGTLFKLGVSTVGFLMEMGSYL